MLTQDALADCRFCSQVSKGNGEDPIGTAGTANHWLVMELPQPWTEQMFKEDPRITPLIELFKKLFMRHGIMMQPVLIAPDREYSHPGKTRVIYYHRPQKQFAQFEKQEFIVPEADFPRLATAIMKQLMKQPNELEAFQSYRQDTSHIREMLVCTHGNIDAACARFGHPIYKQLRDKYTGSFLRVWRCSHFGGHKFAPTLIDLPSGQYWGHLEPEMLDLLVHQQGDVAGLRSHYRGWSGLKKFEQIAEREIWMQAGWDWLSHHKSGKTTCKGLKGVKRFLYPFLRLIPLKQVQFFLEQWTNDATWAEVKIQFTTPEQTASGVYHARVEQYGKVMTSPKSPKSGEELELKSAPQYRVIRLVKR
ncbi:sucraseferredoxin family protein [Leptolyngbya sp. Heron Island J]|uniref:sucrase ferredoxin n=1 Tax=Leptolyngbya sp. Heron Island J TaxID=1385935 RepID=UPI0003B94BEC|nr:sucrase ferredoxin [Leptolyngbya sp. Heron Island J]ESA33703.1 sucraseferredoxin family protein [Leptolyngbya sp. Heron Island J]